MKIAPAIQLVGSVVPLVWPRSEPAVITIIRKHFLIIHFLRKAGSTGAWLPPAHPYR
jgi:hypothetical protein